MNELEYCYRFFIFALHGYYCIFTYGNNSVSVGSDFIFSAVTF